MEKKIIVGCFIAGMLIMITSLFYKEQIEPITYARIFAVGLGLSIPRTIENILKVF